MPSGLKKSIRPGRLGSRADVDRSERLSLSVEALRPAIAGTTGKVDQSEAAVFVRKFIN